MAPQKGGWRTVVAGGGAGAIDCCFTMPLDTLGTQIQLLNKGPLETTRAILKGKGVIGLYAGFWPFLIQSSAKSSIRFLGFEALSNGVDSLGIDRSKMPGSTLPLLACAQRAWTCACVCRFHVALHQQSEQLHVRWLPRFLVAGLRFGCWCVRGSQFDRAHRSREGAWAGYVGRKGQADHRPAACC